MWVTKGVTDIRKEDRSVLAAGKGLVGFDGVTWSLLGRQVALIQRVCEGLCSWRGRVERSRKMVQ